MKNQQKGFSLVVVLALTTLASVVVFASLRDTVIQERLGGNFQKSLNARMASERAAFSQIDAIKAELAANPTSSIDDLVNNIAQINSQSVHAADLRHTSSLIKDTNGDLVIEGYGERYNGDSVANLFINFGFASSASRAGSPFDSAIVGCEGVQNVAGGIIDSYDSSQNNGVYSPSDATSEADVRTIVQDSDVILTGGSITLGDLIATGEVTIQGSAFVAGTVRANGDITVSGGVNTPSGFLSNTRVGGDLLSRGDVRYQGGYINGVLRSHGDVHFTPSFGIRNVNNIAQAVLYRGAVTSTAISIDGETYTSSVYQDSSTFVQEVIGSTPGVVSADPTDPSTNCDPLSISDEATGLTSVNPNSGLNITFQAGAASFSETGGTLGSEVFSPTSAVIFGVNYGSVYYFDQLNIDGGSLTISGDVAMYIDGDFDLTTNGNSRLIIEEDSSLTLIVAGQSVIARPAEFDQRQITTSGLPPFSLFSAYESSVAAPSCFNGDFGVIINATGDIYSAIYAPLGNVAIRASGDLFGSVRGKTVQVCGSGDIHYDTALQGANGTGGLSGSGNTSLIFNGLQFSGG